MAAGQRTTLPGRGSGKGTMCADESWPRREGKPMAAVLQLEVTKLAIPVLSGVSILAVFAAPESSKRWEDLLIRTYPKTESLRPLSMPVGTPALCQPATAIIEAPTVEFPS